MAHTFFRFCNQRLTVTSYFPCSFHKCTMTAKIPTVSSSATGNLTLKIVCIFTIVGFRWLLRRSIIICIFSHWCPLSKKVYFSKDDARELVEYLLPSCLACPSGMEYIMSTYNNEIFNKRLWHFGIQFFQHPVCLKHYFGGGSPFLVLKNGGLL